KIADVEVNRAVFEAQHHALFADVDAMAKVRRNPQQALRREAGMEVLGCVADHGLNAHMVVIHHDEAEQVPAFALAVAVQRRRKADRALRERSNVGAFGRRHSVIFAFNASFASRISISEPAGAADFSRTISPRSLSTMA